MRKGTIVAIFIALIIILEVLLLKNMGTKKTMDESEIKSLMEKGMSYDNIYILREITDGEKTEKYIKDNILVIKTEKNIIWENNDTLEAIYISEKNLLQVDYKDFPEYDVIDYCNENLCEIEYMEEKEIENKECILVNAYAKEGKLEGEKIAIIAIEKDTGLLIAVMSPTEDEIFTKYTYSIGTVTDEDVKRPDFSQYNVLRTEK